jgi:hypothetical protein
VAFSQELATHLHVQLGSGMGMRHSGAVSDGAFFDLVERQLLTEGSRKALGIACYARYRDDILVVLEDISFCPLFDSQLVSLAAPMYTIAKESFSLVGCHMLDLFAYKHLCADGVHKIR